MTAERLRQAATKLREVAEVGNAVNFPTPWDAKSTPIEMGYDTYEKWDVVCEGGHGDLVENVDPLIANYIATMQPSVALAMADILDEDADGLGSYAGEDGDDSAGHDLYAPQIRLAYAILGES